MGETVKANDVMDANAKTRKTFLAAVVGYFVRVGPNKWDDYTFVKDDEVGDLEVNKGIRIQLERQGTEFRMRVKGRVHRLRWEPGDDTQEVARGGDGLRALFLTDYVEAFDSAPGIGFAAAIAKNLR